MEWFVVQAYSGYEQKVKAAMEERIMLADLKEKFGEILVPTEQVVELKSGEQKKTERKFFPGYILIQMELDDDTWQLVKQTPRVSGFVGGTREKPSPITDAEVNSIITCWYNWCIVECLDINCKLFSYGQMIRSCSILSATICDRKLKIRCS